MATTREKFSSQAAPELLAALREIARTEGRHFQAVLEDAMQQYLESREQGKGPPGGDGPLPRQCRKEPAANGTARSIDQFLPTQTKVPAIGPAARFPLAQSDGHAGCRPPGLFQAPPG